MDRIHHAYFRHSEPGFGLKKDAGEIYEKICSMNLRKMKNGKVVLDEKPLKPK